MNPEKDSICWPVVGQLGTPMVTEGVVRQVLNARRVREWQIGADLFPDPAWDILLAALAAELGDKRNSVADLCAASPMPYSVVLRWARKLQDDGWLEREEDASDDSCEWLRLTTHGSQRLQHYFHAAARWLLLV